LKRNTFLAVMLYLLLCVTGCGGNMQSKKTGNTQSDLAEQSENAPDGYTEDTTQNGNNADEGDTMQQCH